MTSSFAPVVNKEKKDHDSNTVRDITDKSLQSSNFFVKYPDFDTVEDKYMAISLNYRGAIKSQEANSTVQWVKQQNKVSFVEWCPTGFKIGLNGSIPASIEGDDIKVTDKTAVMVGNNIAINRVFADRLS